MASSPTARRWRSPMPRGLVPVTRLSGLWAAGRSARELGGWWGLGWGGGGGCGGLGRGQMCLEGALVGGPAGEAGVGGAVGGDGGVVADGDAAVGGKVQAPFDDGVGADDLGWGWAEVH